MTDINKLRRELYRWGDYLKENYTRLVETYSAMFKAVDVLQLQSKQIEAQAAEIERLNAENQKLDDEVDKWIMSELKEAITYFEQLLRRFEDAPDETYWGKEHNATTRKMIGIAIDALRRTQPENAPLTLGELREMDGEPVWVQHFDAPCSINTHGEWKILKACKPTVAHPYVDFADKGICALYYGQGWLAYRRKPERSEGNEIC